MRIIQWRNSINNNASESPAVIESNPGRNWVLTLKPELREGRQGVELFLAENERQVRLFDISTTNKIWSDDSYLDQVF